MQKVEHLPKRNMLRSNYELVARFKYTSVNPCLVSTLITLHFTLDKFH